MRPRVRILTAALALSASSRAIDLNDVGNHFQQLYLSLSRFNQTSIPGLTAGFTFFQNVIGRSGTLGALQTAANETLTHLLMDVKGDALPGIECDACTGLLTTLRAIAAFGDKPFGDTLYTACAASDLEDKDVCQGLVNEEGPVAAEVLRRIDPLGYAGRLFCATIVGVCPYPATIASNLTFPLPPSDPTPNPSRDPSAKPLTVVHFSDWHYDPLYVAGTEAQCTKPLCCRGFNATSPTKAAHVAPSWGAYECDTPLKLGISMLQSVEPTLGGQPDFTIFTGDVPPHDVWLSSPSSVTTNEANSYQLFHQYLKTAVYPAVGNHETSPVNLYQPISFANPPANQYLFNNLTENDWTGWLDEDALAYARTHRGSYTSKPVPGLKIISLNSNDCYVDNFWLLAVTSEVDPNGQLAWLVEELAASEAIGEKVWIISHVAAGLSDCLHNWSNAHNQIVQRYYKTISGIFSGHTHRDEYEIYYSDDSNKTPENAIAVGWIGPSVTPFTQVNPGWRQYQVDPTTFEILDAITYIANLSLAAEWDESGLEPEWFKEYSARDYYPSWPTDAPLNGTFWATVTAAYDEDDELFQKYYLYRSKSGPGGGGGCSGACKVDIIEGLKAGNSVGAEHQSEFTRDMGTKRPDTAMPKGKPWKQDLCRLHSHH